MSDTSTSLDFREAPSRTVRVGLSLAAAGNCRPALMIGCLIVADVFSLSLAGCIAIVLKLLWSETLNWQPYAHLVPLLCVFPLVYSALGLYSGISVGSAEELRRLTLASSLIYLFLGLITLTLRGTHTPFTWSMSLALLLTLVFVPVMRSLVRFRFGNCSWWGYPTVVFGNDKSAAPIIRNLVQDPGLGLKPVGFFSSSWDGAHSVKGVPLLDEDDLAEWTPRIKTQAFAVLAASSESQEELVRLVETYKHCFSHMLVIPEFSGFACLWVTPKNLGGLLGLEVCQQVFSPSRQALKRVIDLTLTAVLLLVLLPAMLMIAVAVKLGSHGPVFYPQRRIGRGGREFYAWKFRSMITEAEAVLETYLDSHPDLRQEWLRTHKLKNDPRTTRLGRFLRKSSLDELPQLWNVLRGEMSLVGPRPIVRDEIARYGDDFKTYSCVPGGLTGLWQVSGRSDTTYQERVDLDRFYVHNWSVWLDFTILFRTIGIVLSRSGAF